MNPTAQAGVRQGRLRHIPALDGIRGIAVIAVLLFHHDELMRGGYLGVDAFFVLSGFLITSLLLDEAARSHRIDLAAFWSRRFRRLLPAMLVTLGGVATYAAVLAKPDELARLRGDAFAVLGYVANWRAIWADHGYWAIFSKPSPLEHLWSLAVEEQFYLVWPLVVGALVWVCGGRRKSAVTSTRAARWLLVGSLGGAFAGAAWMWRLYTPGVDTTRVYLGTDTRAPAILVGVALAAWVSWRGQPAVGWGARRVTLEAAGGLALVGLAVAWVTVDGDSSRLYEGGFLVLGAAVAVVIAAASHPEEGPLARLLAWRPFALVGLVSYGLYLWHWPVYVALDEGRTSMHGAGLLALRVAVSVALAVASFVLVERPVRHGRLGRVDLRLAVPTALAVTVGAVLLATTGTPVVAPSAAAVPTAPRADASGHVLVLGDSVANSIASGAATLPSGLSVTNGAVNGCALTDEITELRLVTRDRVENVPLNPTCIPGWRSAFARTRPEVVAIVFGNASGFEDFRLRGEWVGPCDKAYADWYLRRMGDLVVELRSGGASVAMTTIPYAVAGYLPVDHRARVDCMNSLVREVAADALFDLGRFVCPRGDCRPSADDGTPLRPDGVHFGVAIGGDPANGFAGPGPALAGRWLLDEVTELLGRSPRAFARPA